MKIFQMNECDSVAASTQAEAIEYYIAECGDSRKPLDAPDNAELVEDVEELSDEAMKRMKFVDTDAEKVDGEYPTRSFEEQLALMIAQGQKFPCLFASTEY